MAEQSSKPDWKRRLDQELAKDSKATIYSLATVETGVTEHPVPRVRSLVHRSFFALRGAKENAGSVLLQTTTDIRSAKASHLHEQGARHNRRNVEVVWWFPASQVQFRLLCTGYVLPHSSHPWRDAFPADLDGGGSGSGSGRDGDVTDWEGVRNECFNTLSPYLRASFARPVAPGSELANPEDAKRWPNTLPAKGEEQDESEREHVRVAFENFAVLFLEVFEVDEVDLGVIPNERRLHRLQEGGGGGGGGSGWNTTPLVP
ncbi:hypothetical protein CPB86DRAFT_789688 [Serendipita vermifera]|nr:hypothetical protein CPB86DRAFT_789688 [Serendipita vermifera]